MKLDHVLAALRNGATLHLSLAKKPSWELRDDATMVTISSRAVQAAIRRGVIEGAGDSLFSDVPSQIWRWKRSNTDA
jgi:hypothetical protein